MAVIDASVAFEVFVRTPLGVRWEAQVLGGSRHAPHLIDAEFAQILRRLVLARALQEDIAKAALNDFLDCKIERHAHSHMLERAWELRTSISSYDAMYVALAEQLGEPLYTCDAKLSRSHGHSARIELLS